MIKKICFQWLAIAYLSFQSAHGMDEIDFSRHRFYAISTDGVIRGHVVSVISQGIPSARFIKEYSGFIRLLTEGQFHSFLFENDQHFSRKVQEKRENLPNIDFNCHKGIGKLLAGSDLLKARSKICHYHGATSRECLNTGCLDPFQAVYSTGPSIIGRVKAPNDAVDVGALIYQAAQEAKSAGFNLRLDYLEHLNRISKYFSASQPEQQRNFLMRWLNRNETLCIHHIAAKRYLKLQNQYVQCYLQDTSCSLNEAGNKFSSYFTPPEAYPIEYQANAYSSDLQNTVRANRVRSWLPKINRFLAKGRVLLVVSADSSGGKGGVIEHLQAQGYQIKPVKMSRGTF